MKIVEKYLLISLLLLLPTQLAYHFWPSWSFVFGLRVDMLAPTIYLTDLLVVSLIILNIKIYKPFLKYILFFIAFVFFNTLFSTSSLESLYRWIKILEFVGFVIYITKQKIVSKEIFIRSLFYSSVVVSVVGILQFVKSGTLGGIFYWLGERSFNMTTPGIALVSLNGAEHLRVYSTFSHPNSLAGFLGAVLLILFLRKAVKKNILNIVGLGIITICFLFTFSVSAYLGLFFAILLIVSFKKKTNLKFNIQFFLSASILLSLFLPIISPWILKTVGPLTSNIAERLDLSYIAGKIISRHFLTGTGLGTFISNIPNFKGIYSFSWLLQPVHNIFLLIFAETGIFGLLLFCLGIYKLLKTLTIKKKKYCVYILIFVLFTGLTDHYWLTLQQNQLLLSLLIGLSLRYDMHDAK